MTRDYKRNGTVDVFAAMNIATGEVLHDTRRRHAGADMLAFFKWIDLLVPPISTCMSCWTTCLLTSPNRSAAGSPT